MEQTECVQFDDEFGEETLDDDVEMADAEPMDADGGFLAGKVGLLAGNASNLGGGGGSCEEACNNGGGEDMRENSMGGARRKRNKKKRRKGGSATNITDINRFVINTCRQLKEKKSYLIWSAVGCLGVTAISELVKEVDAIQRCGGQKTVDGKRFRTGGGVLWNILKIREPKAYKEIMTKGKEFEKQFRQPQNNQGSGKKDIVSQDKKNDPVSDCPAEIIPCAQQKQETLQFQKSRSSVRDRIRVPVTYDDLLEEGEILEP